MSEWTGSAPLGRDSPYALVRNEDKGAGARQIRSGRNESPASHGTTFSFESWLRAENFADDSDTTPRFGGYASFHALRAQQASDAYQSRANLITLVNSGIIVDEVRGGQERREVSVGRSASSYVSCDHALALRTYEFNMQVVFGTRRAPLEMQIEMLI
ncbi:MAG: hypothetical protein FD149_609 [Rhodospirillaceae bacterium]|nr:MAG: hypothetical protein FD149_609 [Rhodospirillaceae bacterium]